MIYTTDAIESLNRSLRKVLKTKGFFPNEESVYKLLSLALNNIAKKWMMPIRDWKAALMHFAIEFPDRFPQFSSMSYTRKLTLSNNLLTDWQNFSH